MNESISVEDLPVEGLTRFSDNARKHTDVPNFIAACGDIHGYGFDADKALGDLPGGVQAVLSEHTRARRTKAKTKLISPLQGGGPLRPL